MPFIEANWIWLLIALVIGVAVIWWVWGRSTAPAESAQPEAKPAPAEIVAPPAQAETIAAIAATSPLGLAGDIPPIVAPLPPQEEPVAKAVPKAAAKVAAAKPPVKKAQEPAAAKPRPAAKAAAAAPDKLIQLKGVGPKLVALLGTLGVTRFAEIAGWTDADVERVDAQLGTFRGRIVRDHWIEQAGYLAKGDIASFEAKFGKLDGEN